MLPEPGLILVVRPAKVNVLFESLITKKKIFVYKLMIGVLRSTHEQFSCARIVLGGNRAGREKNPQPSAANCLVFPRKDRKEASMRWI